MEARPLTGGTVAGGPERRYERLHPRELQALGDAAPIAWVPVGPLEFHGPHLPLGVDAFEAHGLLLRAAAQAGGVVLPPLHIGSSCLDLPYTLTYPPPVVEAVTRATLEQLAAAGFRCAVVLTGHCPLDLIHLLKRVCGEAEAALPGFRALGLGWLELNVRRLDGSGGGARTVVDHAAFVETSWMLALQPDLVRLDRLPADPDARIPGVYGENPRTLADAEWGEQSLAAAAHELATMARAALAGTREDPLDDLRRFVGVCWPEPLRVTAARGGGAGEAVVVLHNPGRASRHVSGLAVELDGERLDPAAVWLRNAAPGEPGGALRASELTAERGLYIRHDQHAALVLPVPVSPGPHAVRLELGLGGVRTAHIEAHVPFEAVGAPAGA